MSGHLDSRASDVMDTRSDAPGADDNASGVIVSILSAQAMAAKPGGYRATLIFAAVAGEEQGLLGARRMKARLGREGYQGGGESPPAIRRAPHRPPGPRARGFLDG